MTIDEQPGRLTRWRDAAEEWQLRVLESERTKWHSYRTKRSLILATLFPLLMATPAVVLTVTRRRAGAADLVLLVLLLSVLLTIRLVVVRNYRSGK